MRLGILGSTRGTIMLTLIDAIEQKNLPAEIALVLSDKPDALILEKAKAHHLTAQFLDGNALSPMAYDEQMTAMLKEHAVELVILIGYMRSLSKTFMDTWKDRLINVYPALSLDFSGKKDLDVHQAVLDAKLNQSGCTVHLVASDGDGAILLQKKCIVLPSDNAERLKARVQELEATALIEVIKKMITNPR